ncbi:NAD(P)/FAD-dependent oxidoreductase [Sinomonas halotolerans]|uniref:NAD(P)/FAD-dependent oxidoreductase n=1 Tax=Sinomonas halotolerans TaxID=1644133 RepID=A0ABU9WZE4_9MICC
MDGRREAHDAVIVGAGPAGLCLGVLLARAGVGVVVLEARTEPTRHSRAIGIHPPGQRVLAAAGALGPLAEAGTWIREGVARSRTGGQAREVGRLAFEPPILAVPQWRTEAALEARLEELAPGAIRRGVRAVRVEQGASGVVVRCTAGDAEPPAGTGSPAGDAGPPAGIGGPVGEMRLGARWAVVAAGARSALLPAEMGDWTAEMGYWAAEMGGSPRTFPDAYLMGDFPDTLPPRDATRAVLHLEPEGIVESFPLPGGLRRWVVHLDAPATGADPARLAGIIAERTGAAVEPASCAMLSAFTVSERLAPRLRAGRVLRIGDAAHEVSPIGGQGMTLGWLDAEAFAPLIAADFRGARSAARPEPARPEPARPEPARPEPAWPELWAAAERGRLRAARLAARQARLNMALGRPLPPRTMAARNALFALAYRIPWLARRTAARFTMRA